MTKRTLLKKTPLLLLLSFMLIPASASFADEVPAETPTETEEPAKKAEEPDC